jgi:hypothetical protein
LFFVIVIVIVFVFVFVFVFGFGFDFFLGLLGFSLYTADPTIMYNNQVFTSILTSANGGVCSNLEQWGSFDRANSEFVWNVPQNRPDKWQYLNGSFFGNLNTLGLPISTPEQCPDQFLFQDWVYYSPLVTKAETLSLGFDIRSITAAIALNFGIIKMSDMTMTSSPYGIGAAGGIPGHFHISVLYAPHDPIFCADIKGLRDKYKLDISDAQVSGPPICFLVKGAAFRPIFFYPITAALNYNLLTAQETICTCPDDMHVAFCNERDFVIAMFYDTDRAIANITKPFEFALSLQQFLIDDSSNGDLYMQRYVANFLSSSLYLSYTPGNANYEPQSGWNLSAGMPGYYDYSFLQNMTYSELHMSEWQKICPWGTCGAFVFESYKVNLLDQFLPLNKYNYQVRSMRNSYDD